MGRNNTFYPRQIAKTFHTLLHNKQKINSTKDTKDEEIEKFNPYHDRLGRFTSAGGAASFTIRTRSGLWQGANDKAIQREKDRMTAIYPTEAQAKTLKGIENRTRNLKKEQFRVVDRDGNVILTKQGDKNSVSYRVGEARENFPGNITIHNHPSGGTFSSDDLSGIGYGAKEIRAAAPEGTYILRNLNYGTKWVDGQKTWFEMRDDVDNAAARFLKPREIKKQIQQKHSERYQREVGSIAERWVKEKESGTSQDILDSIAKEYNAAAETFRQSIEREVRSAYVDQHHQWFKANSQNYGLEYEFIPANKRVKKSFYEVEAMSFNSILRKSDDIVLDEKMNKEIEQITGDIMSDFQKGMTFAEIAKFNPYHDRLGRFSSAGGATSFTYAPGKSKAHDLAIAREKERTKNMAAGGGSSTTTVAGGGSSEQSTEEVGPGNKKLNLNQDYIRRADDNSMMGTAGTIRAKEAQRRVDDFKEEFKEKENWTDEQKQYVKQRQDEYTDLVSEYYNDQIRRTGENVSWAVAGPANYNVKAHDKKLNAQMNKVDEYEQKMKNFKENTRKQLEKMTPEDQQIARWRNGKWKNGETIDAADPLAEKKMQAKLDYLTESQQKMKDANKYYSKNGSMKGFEGFSESTNASIDRQMQDFASRGMSYLANKPFQSYNLTNNNAQIKATKQRLDQLKSNKEKAAASASSGNNGATSFSGGQVVRNTGINRLQIKFDSIPDAATRQKLKSSGWRWSPKEGAWQRQLTANAEYSAKQLLDSFGKSIDYEKKTDDFTIIKADSDKRLVFGWANIATRANGEVIQDWQDDIVDPEDLEEAVYEYVLNFRDSGEEHQPGLRKKGRMVESVVFTDEKLEAMGIPKGTVPLGWWIGFYIDDDEAWKKVKNGTYTMFSVEGSGQRVPVEDLDTRMKKSIAKSFSELAKFNPYHGRDGRFTGPGGAASFTYAPGKSKAHDNAIARERARMAAGGNGSTNTAGAGVKVGDYIERKGLTVKVLDVNEGTDRALVEVVSGTLGTRKPGSKFDTSLKTLNDSKKAQSNSGSGETKAISIDIGNGQTLTYRERNGVITDLNDIVPKNTNNRSLSQILQTAKEKGFSVKTYDEKQLQDHDAKRQKEREETNRTLNAMSAKDRSNTYRAPRKGFKGH